MDTNLTDVRLNDNKKTVEDVVWEISAPMKEMKYRKNKHTWYKKLNDLTIVFSIQKSQYDCNSWWYVFGICLDGIAKEKARSIRACHISYRTDRMVHGKELTPIDLVQLVMRWEEMYGNLRRLQICAVEGRLPGQYSRQAVSYLTSCDISRLDSC